MNMFLLVFDTFKVDNQLPGAIFSTVFNPLAPPKSIALDSGVLLLSFTKLAHYDSKLVNASILLFTMYFS